MKSLRDYLNESEYAYHNPMVGDNFAINVKEECLLETYICDETKDGIVLHADDRLMDLLESYGYIGTQIDEATSNSIEFQGRTVDRASIELDDVDSSDYPDFSDAYISYATYTDGTPLGDDELNQFNDQYSDLVHELAYDSLHEDSMDEAEYHGRDVPLNKPMQGDVKKSKVYVKNPKGNIVKVNFGDPNMTIKKSNPARRKSFRARHNCENPGPKTSARYWSCRAW
jgi:hypothetical protein